MATWGTHLMIADRVLKQIPELCRHEFCVGNIAPDCNVENEDWTSFTPSREVTHWMSSKRKVAADCDRFYYAHLITDAEFQRFIRDEDRIKACWVRIKSNSELQEMSMGMPETWDSIKKLIITKERMYDIYSLEREYLDENPDSGYLTEIIGLEAFPDYVDYLPTNAIPRKIKVMGYMPQKKQGKYPYIAMTKEEYNWFLDSATKLVVDAIHLHKR